MLLFTMFLMGIVLGFTGTGGSGFIIALLVVAFGIPIHTALGVSLASMVFSTCWCKLLRARIQLMAQVTSAISQTIGLSLIAQPT